MKREFQLNITKSDGKERKQFIGGAYSKQQILSACAKMNDTLANSHLNYSSNCLNAKLLIRVFSETTSPFFECEISSNGFSESEIRGYISELERAADSFSDESEREKHNRNSNIACCLNTIPAVIGRGLQEVTNIDDLMELINTDTDTIERVHIVSKKGPFTDLPYKKLVPNIDRSSVFKYEIEYNLIPFEASESHWLNMFYFDTIYGAQIVFDLRNKEIFQELYEDINTCGLYKDLGSDVYHDMWRKSYLAFKTINNKYFVLLSTRHELLDHPIYFHKFLFE